MQKAFSTLRSRIILLVVLALIPSFLFLYQMGVNQKKQAMKSAEAEVIHLSVIASKMQVGMVENVKAFLLTVAHMPTIRAGNMVDCNEFFAHMVSDHFDYYSSFYVSDLEGNVLCSPPGGHDEPDFDGCDHYKNLIASDNFVYSGYHVCRQTGKSVLSIGYPIYDFNNVRAMVTNVSLDLAWFYDFAEDASLIEGAHLILVDQYGTILSHYPDNDRWRGLWLPEGTVLADLFEQKEGVLIGNDLHGEESIYAISSMDGTADTLYLLLGLPTQLAFADANRILQMNMMVLFAVMVIAIFLIWLLGDAIIFKQAQTLVGVTKKLANGELSSRTGLNYKNGELGQVAQAFDSMAAQLESREEERKQHEEELKEYALDLEQSNQELRDFTFIASHDLQEPLRKIQTFGELLRDRYSDDLDARGSDYVQRMQNAARRMQLLIDKLLSYSRVTTNAQPFIKVDMNQITRQVITDLDMLIEESKATVRVSEISSIEADPVQMNHLMLNLISNALKFHAPDTSPIVNIYCKRQMRADKEFCELFIQDNGIGMEEKYFEKIFLPFQRLHGRNEYEGAGMGLTICKKIVERHGGTIRVESTPGKGSTFIVALPMQQFDKERQG